MRPKLKGRDEVAAEEGAILTNAVYESEDQAAGFIDSGVGVA